MTGTHITYNNFEIIAIIREIISRKSIVIIPSKNPETILITKIHHIDVNGFYILAKTRAAIEKNIISFIVNDNKAQFLFLAKYNSITNINNNYYHHFSTPKKISTIQRRWQARLYLDILHNFFCYGRFKSGNSYCFKIKNISTGGCALIFEASLYEENTKDTILRNTILDFGIFGKITIDLEVLDEYLIPQTTLKQLSCKFKPKQESKVLEVDKIITRVIIYKKKLSSL